MAVSTFDLFKIGFGPSSSHTVGPMRAAARFVEKWLVDTGDLQRTARIRAEVYGSLTLTGRDMQDKYKETSRGGLAVNVIEC